MIGRSYQQKPSLQAVISLSSCMQATAAVVVQLLPVNVHCWRPILTVPARCTTPLEVMRRALVAALFTSVLCVVTGRLAFTTVSWLVRAARWVTV